MAKRIKDNRKRKRVWDAETIFAHHKLMSVFSDLKERLHYVKTLISELDAPPDPVLEAGGYPELGIIPVQ